MKLMSKLSYYSLLTISLKAIVNITPKKTDFFFLIKKKLLHKDFNNYTYYHKFQYFMLPKYLP